MRWFNSKFSGCHGSCVLWRVFFFAVLLCFLSTFALGLADELTDPDSPDSEHPWDDVLNSEWDQGPSDPPEVYDPFTFPLGFDFWITIQLQPAGGKEGLDREKAFKPSERKGGHLFIFIK